MREDERKPLNRESVKAMLTRRKKMELVMFAVMGGFFALILIIAIATEPGFAIFGVIMLVSLGLFAAPTVRYMYLIKKDRFSIIEAELMGMNEIQRGRVTTYIYDFGQYGQGFDDNRTLRDLSSVGETLYVAILHDKKDKVVGIYHPLLYRLTDH